MTEQTDAGDESTAPADAPAAQGEPDGAETSVGTATIPVSGMTCSGCADNVQTALSQLDGVGRVEVDVEGAVARVESAGAGAGELDESALRAAVERIGLLSGWGFPSGSRGRMLIFPAAREAMMSTPAVLLASEPTDRLPAFAAAVIAGYSSPSARRSYAADLRQWFAFCRQFDLDPLAVPAHPDIARRVSTPGLRPSELIHQYE